MYLSTSEVSCNTFFALSHPIFYSHKTYLFCFTSFATTAIRRMGTYYHGEIFSSCMRLIWRFDIAYHCTGCLFFIGAFKKHFLPSICNEKVPWSYVSIYFKKQGRFLFKNESPICWRKVVVVWLRKIIILYADLYIHITTYIYISFIFGYFVYCCRTLVGTSRAMSDDWRNDFVCARDKQQSFDDMAPSILHKLSEENYQRTFVPICTRTLKASCKGIENRIM